MFRVQPVLSREQSTTFGLLLLPGVLLGESKAVYVRVLTQRTMLLFPYSYSSKTCAAKPGVELRRGN